MEQSNSSTKPSVWCQEQLYNSNEGKSRIGNILKDFEEALNELDTKIEQGALMTLDLLMGISNPVGGDKPVNSHDTCERCKSFVLERPSSEQVHEDVVEMDGRLIEQSVDHTCIGPS